MYLVCELVMSFYETFSIHIYIQISPDICNLSASILTYTSWGSSVFNRDPFCFSTVSCYTLGFCHRRNTILFFCFSFIIIIKVLHWKCYCVLLSLFYFLSFFLSNFVYAYSQKGSTDLHEFFRSSSF